MEALEALTTPTACWHRLQHAGHCVDAPPCRARGRRLRRLTIWRVPQPVPPSAHAFKYRLAYVVGGECVVRYDNERGKGDHRHVGTVTTPYRFDYGEERFITFGLLDGQVVAVAHSEREDVIRIISMRKATRNEEKNYLSKISGS